MGRLDGFRGQTLALDSAPLIYFIEDHPAHAPKLGELFAAAARGDFALVTSTVTIAEVLVHPLRSGRLELVEGYRDILLGSAGMTAVPVSAEIAELAARIRAKHNVRTPDALHLATAIHSGAAAFITNDRGLPKLSDLEIVLLGAL